MTGRRYSARFATLAAAAALALCLPSTAGAREPEPRLEVLKGTPEAAAIVVDVECRCSELDLGSSEVVLEWRIDRSAAPATVAATELAASRDFRVDLTPFPEGLERGVFQTVMVARDSVADSTAHLDLPAGKLPANAGRELLVSDLQPGVTYRARVLAQTPRGWIASEELMFRAAICPVDGFEKDGPGGAR